MVYKTSFLIWIGILFLSLRGRAQEQGGDLWKLRTTDRESVYVGAPMANGGIGLLPWREPFSVRHVILNHVFDAGESQGVSRLLQGINPFGLSMEIDGEPVDNSHVSDWEQMIDMREATHNSQFTAFGKAQVTYSLCALRNMPYAGLIRVTVKAVQPLRLKVCNRMVVPDEYGQPTARLRILHDGGKRMDVFQTQAFSRYRQVAVAASSAFLPMEGEERVPDYDGAAQQMSLSVRLQAGESFGFALVGAVCSQRDFRDPYNESERQMVYAIHQGVDRLMDDHRRLWNELWKSDVQIEGDDEAQRAVRFALFNLYSSVREGSGLSVPPMGLSSQGYNGHVFWDTELWMFPPLLLLNPGMARSMVDYRIDRLRAARQRAMAYGYRGAMFPWESDDAGEEATPTSSITGPFEQHITADVAIACWHYYCVTGDRHWLLSHGYPLLKDVADFWVSRARLNEDGSYSICNVQGADEYASGIDDNAFTNGAAISALRYACLAAQVCGCQADPAWRRVSDKLRILSFDDGVTREHATYDGRMVKQADANLLAYPLDIIRDKEVWKKDLAYYADKIDPNDGPAMSYSVFCVQYARLGDADKAYEMFRRCYQPNLRAPFGVLAETPTSNNPYFMTGAGGLLQAVINGFCGLQITDKGITQLPAALPKHWKRVVVTGVGMERRVYENK